MNERTQMVDFDTAMQDVTRAFGSPAELLAADHLDRAQKLKLLEQWDYDLGLQLVAAEENMAGAGQSATGERLRAVRNAIARLGAGKDPESKSPDKSPTGKVSSANMPERETKAARRGS
ncbi:MAG: hypothetical protein JNL25_07310 [Rhodospirillaceae bacterium]|nr:hypothetical protein [Rhodospirillaceae bacterium]